MKQRYFLKYILSFALLVSMESCWIDFQHSSVDQFSEVEGYRPVYGAQTQQDIELLSPRTVRNPGKIYVYGQFLLVNEQKEGIHIFDNLDPENPEPIGFIQILGNSDLAMRNDILYADHMGNLVALEVGDFETLTEKGSLPLQNWNLGLPPPSGFYFECVDQSKGLVVQWKKVQLKNPNCYAN